ncbi:MAG: methyltransferase domain-containing protein [Rhodospirillales bacterium]
MWIDVVDLRDFYASPLGQAARRMIRRKMRALWPDIKGQRMLGIGYAAPYLAGFRDEADRVIAAMPARQGVLRWPAQGGAQATLVDELELPFPDLSMDRIVLVHALECAEQVEPLMREVWRVLSDSGRLMVIAPNRSGLWARFERTPFGHGRPFSPRQLSKLLRDSMFTPLATDRALYMPPFRTSMLVRSAPAWERAGSMLLGSFAGVVVMEAVKQIYAATPAVQGRRRRAYLPMPQGSSPAAGRTLLPRRPGPR